MSENVFQQMAAKDQAQSTPAPSATPTVQPAPQAQPAQGGNVFEQMQTDAEKTATGPNPNANSAATAAQNKAALDNSEAAKKLKEKQDAGNHGILARAWDWINQPIFDNVLPEGIKTADIIKAAAFEKMYNEAYIPGVNDFNTKAATHFEPAEKMQTALGPKQKDQHIKNAMRDFLKDHAQSMDALANAVNTGTAGAVRDTADMGAGFTSPLSLGTLGLGKAGRVGKVLAPLVGTAFGLQGLGEAGEGAKDLYRTTTWEKLKNGYLDPDAVAKVLGGTGQAALAGTTAVHGAGDLVDYAKGKATPEIKTVAGQEVPVRAENATAQMVQKAVPSEVNEAAARQTGEAVSKGVGDVVGEAVGSDADTNITHQDRLGIRAHSEDLKTKATTAMDKLNELSDGMYNEARDMVDKNKKSPLPEGQDKAAAGRQLMHDIEEQYRPDMEREGHDVDEMRGNYRKAIALEKIAKRFETATEARPGAPGEFDVDGKKLVKAIDDLRKVAGDENDPSHSKNQFHRAGLTEEHVNALADLADTLRDQQETPKFGTLAKLGAKALALAAAGKGIGLGGALEAITGESFAEHIGSKAMGKLFGEALTDVDTARQLNKAIKAGPAGLSNWQKFKDTATRLWQDEHGEMEIPGTGKMGQIGKDVPVNEEPRQDMNPTRRENGDLEFNHPNGTSQMVLHPEPDPRPGFEGKTQLRQTGISAVDAPGAGQEMMDNAVARIKGNDSYSRIISDYPDRRSPDNEGHWNKLNRRGHSVQTEPSTDSFKQPWEDWMETPLDTKLNGGKSGQNYFIDNQPTAQHQLEMKPGPAGFPEAKVEPTEGHRPDSEISTREMTWKDKGVEQREPNNRAHVTGLDAIEEGEKAKPGYIQKLVDKFMSYKDNGFKLSEDEMADPRKGLNAIIEHLADNVTWLHDNMPPELRDIAKKWYDSAHTMAKDIATKNGTTPEKVAAAIASLSPQNPWDMNVGQAERVVKMYQTMQDHPFTDKMDTQLSTEIATAMGGDEPNVEFANTLKELRGKTLADLKGDSYKQALLMRVLDRAHGNVETPVYAPDGKVRSYQRFNWGPVDPIAKSIEIMAGDGSPESIHSIIGDGHRIRNFYNNIISPNSVGGHATIDTHHVNADMLKPMSSKNDVEVKDNFGGSPKNGDAGLKGTYAVHHEALKRAAERRGILPRDMQSIVWEGIRTLMGESKKAAMRPLVNELWQQYQAGDLTLTQVRERIVKAAGGFQEPIWAKERANAKPNTGSNETGKGTANAAELPVLGVRGETSSNTGPGSGSKPSASVPATRTGANDAYEAIRQIDERVRRGARK